LQIAVFLLFRNCLDYAFNQCIILSIYRENNSIVNKRSKQKNCFMSPINCICVAFVWWDKLNGWLKAIQNCNKYDYEVFHHYSIIMSFTRHLLRRSILFMHQKLNCKYKSSISKFTLLKYSCWYENYTSDQNQCAILLTSSAACWNLKCKNLCVYNKGRRFRIFWNVTFDTLYFTVKGCCNFVAKKDRLPSEK